MIKKKTTLFCICFFVVFISLIYLLRGILLPFVMGFVLAYMLNPLVIKLEKHHFSRGWASICVIGTLILLLLLSLLVLIPVLEAQIIAFVIKVPVLSAELWKKIEPVFDLIKSHVSETQLDYVKQTISTQGTNFITQATDVLMQLFSSWGAIFDIVSIVIITPVVTFYLLSDWAVFVAKIKDLYPRHWADFFNKKMSEIDEILSAFIRGQALVCLFLGLFYGIGLSVIGLDFGFSIGFVSGVFSFIPYVGTLTGFALSLLLGFAQSVSWGVFCGILIVFGLGQFLEGYVLTPKLVGNKIHLHPVWVIFALFAGGYLFGFLGILVAVPVAAVLGVVIRTALEFYQSSSFYKGKNQ